MRILRWLAAPLSPLYGAVVRARNRGFDEHPGRATRVPVPVISVGNLSMGGTGKTPVTLCLARGLQAMRDIPTLVMGVASDILFPAWQQREVAESLRKAGNQRVEHVELGEDVSLFGHDTFLLDLEHIGGKVGSFLAAAVKE